MKNDTFLPHLALLLVSLLYGVSYSVIKSVTPIYILPFGFIVYRIFFAGTGMWLLSLGVNEKINWREDGWRLVACAFTGVAFNQLIFFKGISMTSAIHGGLIMTIIPIFVFLLSKIILKESIKTSRIIGLIMAFGGTILIIYQPAVKVVVGNWIGDSLLVVNSLSFSIYLILVKPLMQKYSAMTVTKWIFLIAFCIVLPVGCQQAVSVNWDKLDITIWLSIGYVIIFATLIVYVLNNWALRKVKASTVSIYIYTQPIFATIVAVAFYSEKISLIHVISSIFIFSGVYLVTNIRQKLKY